MATTCRNMLGYIYNTLINPTTSLKHLFIILQQSSLYLITRLQDKIMKTANIASKTRKGKEYKNVKILYFHKVNKIKTT
jgi:hypothetical protein